MHKLCQHSRTTSKKGASLPACVRVVKISFKEGNGGVLKQKLLKATAKVLSSVKGAKSPLQVTVSSSGGWKQTMTSVVPSNLTNSVVL